MRICVFDTETTSVEKPFVYNIGYIIYDTTEKAILHRADYIVEQVWHNKELFTTAYYADKRELYISRMKGRKVKMEKLGYITQTMARQFKDFSVEFAFAYNSSFDERVFGFNCEWFKIINPFDTIPIIDIRGYVHQKIAFTPHFQRFCDLHKEYTESGNYSTTAETVYRYLADKIDFIEEHTALADSEIELEILNHCVSLGAEYGEVYKTYRSIPRKADKVLRVKNVEGEITEFPYNSIMIYKEKDNKTRIILKKRVDKTE